MSTAITAADQVQVGDLVRCTKDETSISGRVAQGGWVRSTGLSVAGRLNAGWEVELLERPVPAPELGVYVWRASIASDGVIKDSARVVKRKPTGWADGEGRALDGFQTREVERAYAAGKLHGPLRGTA